MALPLVHFFGGSRDGQRLPVHPRYVERGRYSLLKDEPLHLGLCWENPQHQPQVEHYDIHRGLHSDYPNHPWHFAVISGTLPTDDMAAAACPYDFQ